MGNSLDSRSSKITQSSFEDYRAFEIKSNTNLIDASNNFWSILNKLNTERNLKDQSVKEEFNYLKSEFQTECIYAPGVFGSIFSIKGKDTNLGYVKRNFRQMNMAVYDIEYFPPILDHPHRDISLSKVSIQSNRN